MAKNRSEGIKRDASKVPKTGKGLPKTGGEKPFIGLTHQRLSGSYSR